MIDRDVHRRYLDYRESYEYFARGEPRMSLEEFAPLDAELRALSARDDLDDEEEVRKETLARLLYRD